MELNKDRPGKLRLSGHVTVRKTENEPGAEVRELQQDLVEWHEDVFSDECPWANTEQEPAQD